MTISFARFPAAVTMPDGTRINRAAVVVIDGRALLATEPPHQHHEPGGVQVTATLEDVTVDAPQRGRESVLRAADGQVWMVGNGDGCNCASALKSWFQGHTRGQRVGT